MSRLRHFVYVVDQIDFVIVRVVVEAVSTVAVTVCTAVAVVKKVVDTPVVPPETVVAHTVVGVAVSRSHQHARNRRQQDVIYSLTVSTTVVIRGSVMVVVVALRAVAVAVVNQSSVNPYFVQVASGRTCVSDVEPCREQAVAYRLW